MSDGVVALRPWVLGDLSCVASASLDRDIPKGTTVPIGYSHQAGRDWIERQWSRAVRGEGISLAIVDDADEAMGCVVLLLRAERRSASIGYWVLNLHRRKGYATRAVRLLSSWALLTTPLRRIEATVIADNLRSQQVLLSAGFEPDDGLSTFLRFPDGCHAALVFSRSRPS